MSASFFLPGDASDVGYLATRDHPRGRAAKELCESLWALYAPLADPHFREDARTNFLQRFWEMYLAVALKHHGMTLTRYGNEGPEFYAESGGRRIWIEAIAPRQGEGPDRVPEVTFGAVIAEYVPVEKILLRFTSALAAKRERYVAAVKKGIILPQDAYVLALNSRGIPRADISDGVPYFVQAFLPFGPVTVIVDTNTLGITETFRAYRPSVRKANSAAVSTRTFLDPESGFCSAVLHSSVDCANHPSELGGDFVVLHNPQAVVPINANVFGWCEQLYLRENQLHREPRQPT
jgi:hypothetical protein